VALAAFAVVLAAAVSFRAACCIGCSSKLRQLVPHVPLCVRVARLCTSKRFEHGPKRQLHLVRIDRLGLLAEELALEAFELVEHERVALAVLFTLVLGLVARLTQTRELSFERSDPCPGIVVLLRGTVTHAP
jgi:hypothetical protein